METSLAAMAGLFASVFTLSGVTKMRRPVAVSLAIRRFGVAGRAGPAYGRLLGVAELALAALFVLFPADAAPFTLAAALLAIFLVLIVRSLNRGDRFPCACFGKSDENLSIATAARTGALLIAAALAGVAAALVGVGSMSVSIRINGVAFGTLDLCSAALATNLAKAHPFSTMPSPDV